VVDIILSYESIVIKASQPIGARRQVLLEVLRLLMKNRTRYQRWTSRVLHKTYFQAVTIMDVDPAFVNVYSQFIFAAVTTTRYGRNIR
jgi:hypothetical protein